MKHLKIYESFNRQINVGDYCVIDKDFFHSNAGAHLTTNDIGQVHNISPHFWVKFNGRAVSMNRERIAYWSESREELETMLAAKNYNL